MWVHAIKIAWTVELELTITKIFFFYPTNAKNYVSNSDRKPLKNKFNPCIWSSSPICEELPYGVERGHYYQKNAWAELGDATLGSPASQAGDC